MPVDLINESGATFGIGTNSLYKFLSLAKIYD